MSVKIETVSESGYEKQIVHIRRGDTGYLTVTIQSGDEPYDLETGDVLELTVRKTASEDSDVVFSKTSYNGTFRIEPTDTTDVNPGKYAFDVQLKHANGDIDTVVPPTGNPLFEGKKWNNFCIEPEVTIDGGD